MTKRLILVHIIFNVLLTTVRAFHTGAPDSQYYCDSLTPGHDPTTNDPTLPLYVSASKVDGADQYSVRIWSENGTFRGFLLTALPMNSSDTLNGNFSTIPNDTKTICNGQGITHTINSVKTELLFTYTVDQSFQGEAYFKAVIVISLSSDWKISSSLENPALPPPSTSARPDTTPRPSGGIVFDTECGVSKGCYPSSCNGGCPYLITWQNQGSHVTFEMILDSPSVRAVGDVYHAIGFSEDDQMGSDSVIMCISSGGVQRVEAGRNLPGVTSYQPLSDPLKGLSGIVTTTEGNILKCTFNRVINSSDADVASLEKTWILLFANGRTSGGTPMKHNLARASDTRVDFLAATLVTAADPDNSMVKVHGSLMIVAWILFSSIGIVTARFYKAEWPDQTIQKQKVWFQIHRSSMIFVLLITAVSFIIIFVEQEGYHMVIVSDDRTYLESHPILGIIVTCLTCINPIMALFRCSPDHKMRPLFNIAHFTVGTSSHILAAITIVFGMNLDRSDVPTSANYVMYAYVATFVVIEVILEIWRCAESNSDKSEPIALHNLEDKTKEADNANSAITFTSKNGTKKPILLYCHIVAMLVFTVALMILVFQSNSD